MIMIKAIIRAIATTVYRVDTQKSIPAEPHKEGDRASAGRYFQAEYTNSLPKAQLVLDKEVLYKSFDFVSEYFTKCIRFPFVCQRCRLFSPRVKTSRYVIVLMRDICGRSCDYKNEGKRGKITNLAFISFSFSFFSCFIHFISV